MDLIYRCATLGESNSALLIGPRGSGKSMVRIKPVINFVNLSHIRWDKQQSAEPQLKKITELISIEIHIMVS